MDKNQIKEYLQECRERYASGLTTDILPFWLEHGLDRVNGGVYTCVDRAGNLMDTTKSVWFQGRCAFVYSFAYNNIERRPEYLDMARSCLDFIEAHCFDRTDGRMYFEVTADGRPLRKRRYVFSECFAAIAMSEYSISTGDTSYARNALDLFKDIRRFIATPGMLPPKYESTLQARSHSITMILINTASCLRRAGITDPVIDEQIDESLHALATYFVHPEYKALLEMTGMNGEVIDTLAGRTINPGHCIETSWFLLEEARHRSDSALEKLALQILDWSWEWGWDDEFGGIINFRDCKGFPNQAPDRGHHRHPLRLSGHRRQPLHRASPPHRRVDLLASARPRLRRMVRLSPPRRHRGPAGQGQPVQRPVPHPAHDGAQRDAHRRYSKETLIPPSKP